MWLIIVPFPAVVAQLFAVFRPYKKELFQHDWLFRFYFIGIISLLDKVYNTSKPHSLRLLYVSVTVDSIFVFCFFFTSYKLLSCVGPFRTCCRRIGEILEARNTIQSQHLPTPRRHNRDEDLPDRIVNPDMYQPLLPATNISSNGDEDFESDRQPQAGVNSLMPYGSM